MKSKKAFVAVLTAGLAVLALSACGAGSTTAETSTATSKPSGMSAAPAGEFGPGCAAVPTDPSNAGSFEAMAKVPVATAASGNPLLSMLVTAVKKASLVDTLNGTPAITVFAPTNDAFAKISKTDLDKVLADNATLSKILTYHVVAGKIGTDQLVGTHKTLQGSDIKVTGSGSDFTVNGTAKVVCGSVQTANATVYIIDSVLMPM